MRPESCFSIAVGELALLFVCQLILVQCKGFQTCWAAIQHFRNAIFIPPLRELLCVVVGVFFFFKHLATAQGKSVCTSDQTAGQPQEVPVSRMKSVALTKMRETLCITRAKQLQWISWRGRCWEGNSCA